MLLQMAPEDTNQTATHQSTEVPNPLAPSHSSACRLPCRRSITGLSNGFYRLSCAPGCHQSILYTTSLIYISAHDLMTILKLDPEHCALLPPMIMKMHRLRILRLITIHTPSVRQVSPNIRRRNRQQLGLVAHDPSGLHACVGN